jgi:hypothetical protein
LCNARKHAVQLGQRYAADWLDPFSSAGFFDGWTGAAARPPDASIQAPRGWLLKAGWRKRGLLAPGEVPGGVPR